MQSTEAACGPCAVANACKALELAVTEADATRWIDRVRRKDHPGVEGTSDALIARAIAEAAPKRYRLSARLFTIHDPAIAQAALRGFLEAGQVALLAVDPEEGEDGVVRLSHWTAAVGRNGDRFLIADAADTEVVLAYSPPALLTRWELPGEPVVFCGVVISRGTR